MASKASFTIPSVSNRSSIELNASIAATVASQPASADPAQAEMYAALATGFKYATVSELS
jgi:hypothetical protein